MLTAKLAKLFQRRRLKYEKVKGQMPSDGNTSHGPNPNKTNSHDIIEILLKVVLNTVTPNPNKTNRHDIIEILLKVALNTVTPNPNKIKQYQK